ncbi:formyltetrahydrofolate deformylase [Arthrobacter sp. KNU40]|uniref:formyltetrahydrofolate deformylase n=1 Tax=Arthrobacter sp. KNU40 TaxID=3447965 RepID=UPI003F5E3FD4
MACLIVHGPDRPGIVSAVATLLKEHQGNIVSLDQYSENEEGGHFFQRTLVRVANLSPALGKLRAALDKTVKSEMGLEYTLSDYAKPKRVAILASKSDHCLLDLLWRQRRGELPITITMVISNHPDMAEEVQRFGIPYFHVPTQGVDRRSVETEHLRLLRDNVDFVVLARYMQILSPEFIRDLGAPIINIHHSFLPAFIGAGPYAKAKQRGVKLIGATAHYVTEELDEGPIIDQDVVRVTHADSAPDMQRRGADVERAVLSRAVQWHAEERVILFGGHTVVFA